MDIAIYMLLVFGNFLLYISHILSRTVLLFQINRHLCMFFVGRVDYRVATDLADFTPVTVKRPATNFARANHILDKQNSTVKAQRHFVKKLDVFQEIIVRSSGKMHTDEKIIKDLLLRNILLRWRNLFTQCKNICCYVD